MCHAPVAFDVTAAAFVPDTEGVQVSTGTLTLVGIHRDVTEEFQREFTFYLAPLYPCTVLQNLLRALALDS